MLLYSPQESPRLRFVIDFLNDHFFSEELIITSNLDLFLVHEGLRINYSAKEIAGTYQINPEGLLFETDIRLTMPAISIQNEAMFMFDGDILSSIFYYLSRYEEYQSDDRDEHGRFLAKHSLSAQYDLVEKPLVDIWASELTSQLESLTHIEITKTRHFKFLCTFDIDVAYAYKGRNFLRSIGASIKNTLERNRSFINEKRAVLSNRINDPYDTYGFQREIIDKNKLEAIYFFHVGKFGKYDHQISYNSPELDQLLEFVEEYADVALHPSYIAYNNKRILEFERNRLEKLTGKVCKRSRMHYLRLELPSSYLKLSEIGIKEDYTMGFADRPGFRAGTSLPFNFYDLVANSQVPIKLYPLTLMESSFIYYLKTDPANSLKKIKQLVDEVLNVNGQFISLWHNQSLSETNKWVGWRNLFIEMVDYILKRS